MSILNFGKRKERRAELLHEEGMALSDSGDNSAAIEKYLQAIKLNPKRSTSLYNLGLIYKYRGDWKKSLEFNQRAYEVSSDDESTRWNLAIAATALNQWNIARAMWKDQGLELDDESGPIQMNLGMTPVRLNPDTDGEVVWATRIDPVRARIENIPLPSSGFRCGDIVLHDGAPVGQRVANGQEYSVFNVLELYESSGLGTFRARVVAKGPEPIESLQQLFEESGLELEDWTQNIRQLCRQCSEGTPHEHHDRELETEDWLEERELGISAIEEEKIIKLLEEWATKFDSQLIDVACEQPPKEN